jgi:hypothetical protein
MENVLPFGAAFLFGMKGEEGKRGRGEEEDARPR